MFTAADDEEFWAGPLGLTPAIFWENALDILSLDPEEMEVAVEDVCKSQGPTSSSRIVVRNDNFRGLMLPSLTPVCTLSNGIELLVGDVTAIGASTLTEFCEIQKIALVEVKIAYGYSFDEDLV